MEFNISKEDFEKYNVIELYTKLSKNPIIINGKIEDLTSNAEEFYVKTQYEQFKIYTNNIESIHYKSSITSNVNKVIPEVCDYLDL